MVRSAHESSSQRSLVGAWPSGEFPLRRWMQAGVSAPVPVVVDTNVLRNEVRRRLRHAPRTVLVNTANEGAVVLMAPPRVVDELVEHADDFGGEFGGDRFLAALSTEVLPVLRVVNDVPDWVFTASELARIEQLVVDDIDDVPLRVLRSRPVHN